MTKKILVIEDEYDIASTIELCLEMEGHEIRLCSNGADALAILEAEALPDLVLCDIMMPIMDGYQFAKTLRSHKRFKHLPLVLMSAGKLDDSHINAGLIQGFIRKPFDLNHLLDVVASILV